MPEPEASVLAELSRAMVAQSAQSAAQQESRAADTADNICQLAVSSVPGCDHASITQRERRDLFTTTAASSGLARALDDAQYEAEEGPCADAAREGLVHHSDRLAHDDRWTTWRPRAVELGCRAVLAVPLLDADGTAMGAINFYAERPDVWDVESREFAHLFSTHAALALESAHVIVGLRTAITNRHHIGIAQGILMTRYGLDVDRSFEVLRRHSQETNTKLSDVAARIVAELGSGPV